MRVVINYAPAQGQRTGIGQYTAQLVEHLAPLVDLDKMVPHDKHFLVRTALQAWKAMGLPTPATMRAGRLKSCLRDLVQHLCGKRFHKKTPPARYDLYHEPNYLPWPTELPTVATWHDLSAFDHPEWHPCDRVQHFERRVKQALARTHHFIADSDFTRRGLIRRFHIAPERVTRVHLGIRHDLAPLPPEQVIPVLKQLDLPADYLLHVGTVEPRKNLLLLMRAYCALPSELRSRCPLLLVGGWGWEVETVRRFYQSEARHRGVRHMGYLADEHLGALYNGARALVFPTLYEGFGFPPLEMLACGGAVLSSKAEAVVEVLGPHAHQIDADDEAGWCAALARACRADDWLTELRRGGIAHARSFTWERCARETLAVYQQVVNRQGQQIPMPRAA